MQELATGAVNDSLKRTHVVARSVAPALSEYCSAKVWLHPLPDAGVTESAVTVGGGPGGGGCPSWVIGRISQMLKFHWSVVGAVVLIVTAEPVVGVAAVRRCTQ